MSIQPLRSRFFGLSCLPRNSTARRPNQAAGTPSAPPPPPPPTPADVPPLAPVPSLWRAVCRWVHQVQAQWLGWLGDALRYLGWAAADVQVCHKSAEALFRQPLSLADSGRSKSFPELPLAQLCVRDFCRQTDVAVVALGHAAADPVPQKDVVALTDALRAVCDGDDAWVQAVTCHLNQSLPAVLLSSCTLRGYPYMVGHSPHWSFTVSRQGDEVEVTAHHSKAPCRADVFKDDDMVTLRPHPYAAAISVRQLRPTAEKTSASLVRAEVDARVRQPGLSL